ncbi:MAG: hypothetical protein HY908_15225 [Myxococcales bacterium]|nr:hypothetical protein [Myxococcales bacterium]
MTLARIALVTALGTTLGACAAPSARGGPSGTLTASATGSTVSHATAAPSGATGPNAPTPSASAPASTAPSDPFACGTDADCWSSCRHGAVSKAWWQASYPGDEGCDDGCTSKGFELPRCEGGSCVAYFQGRRADDCTRRDLPVVAGPGPAHRCSGDADCKVSCRYGAVNKAWYGYAAKDECKDGCARAAREARCEAGACVAYANGARVASCTGRSIHEP